MSYENWLNYLKSAQKSSLINGGLRKVFYKFPDGKSMMEEYNMETGVIQKRAWRRCHQMMGDSVWEVELGENDCQFAGGGDSYGSKAETDELTCRISNTEPFVSKRLTKRNIEWRIRNLPYPIDVYSVQADAERKAIIVRTTNKKYYKIIEVPELERCNLLPVQDNLAVHHQYNTLIITYRKPELVNDLDAQVLLLLKDVETETSMDELFQGLLKK